MTDIGRLAAMFTEAAYRRPESAQVRHTDAVANLIREVAALRTRVRLLRLHQRIPGSCLHALGRPTAARHDPELAPATEDATIPATSAKSGHSGLWRYRGLK